MKFKLLLRRRAAPDASPPSRGAWIEMQFRMITHTSLRSPPSRGAWIEIKTHPESVETARSPPSRGAWIEIFTVLTFDPANSVAPLAGGVD